MGKSAARALKTKCKQGLNPQSLADNGRMRAPNVVGVVWQMYCAAAAARKSTAMCCRIARASGQASREIAARCRPKLPKSERPKGQNAALAPSAATARQADLRVLDALAVQSNAVKACRRGDVEFMLCTPAKAQVRHRFGQENLAHQCAVWRYAMHPIACR